MVILFWDIICRLIKFKLLRQQSKRRIRLNGIVISMSGARLSISSVLLLKFKLEIDDDDFNDKEDVSTEIRNVGIGNGIGSSKFSPRTQF